MDRRLYQKGVVLLVVLLCQLTMQAQNNQQWRDSLTVLNKVCTALGVNIGEIMEFLPDSFD